MDSVLNFLKNKKYKYEVKLADLRLIETNSLEYSDKGVKIKYYDKKRFIPYGAILWVDSNENYSK